MLFPTRPCRQGRWGAVVPGGTAGLAHCGAGGTPQGELAWEGDAPQLACPQLQVSWGGCCARAR